MPDVAVSLLTGVNGAQPIAPPHPEEPAEASAMAGVSKDEVAGPHGSRRRADARLLTMRIKAAGSSPAAPQSAGLTSVDRTPSATT